MTVIQVECYSGYRYGERPKALTWEGVRLEVAAVLATWRCPGRDCYLVKMTDDQVMQVSYLEESGEWVAEAV